MAIIAPQSASRSPPVDGFRSLLLLALGAAVFAGSFSGQFIFDDIDAIQQNANLDSLNPLVACRSALGLPLSGRPVVAYSFALNRALTGASLASYHLFNLFIHLAAGGVLFDLIRRLAIRLGTATASAGNLAFAIAALWLIHPMQTESVTYLVQRTELLAGLFILLTLYGTLRASSSHGPTRGWTGLAVISCALGMASKEIVAVVPVLALVLDRTASRTPFRTCLRKHPAHYSGLAATWTILLAILLLNPRGNSAALSGRVAPFDYLLTQSSVILHYLQQTFWPTQLSIDYNDWAVAKSIGEVWGALLIMAGLLAATIIGLVRNTWWSFPATAFFLILAPTSSFIPILSEPAAERRMYLPLAAVLSIFVAGLAHLTTRAVERGAPRIFRSPALGITLFVAVLAPLSIATVQRNRLYANPAELYRDTLRKRPRNDRLMTNLAVTLVQAGPAGYSEALDWLLKAEALCPDHPVIQSRLGWVLQKLNRPAEAEPHLRKAVALHPESAEFHLLLGAMLHTCERFDESLPELSAASELAPRDPRPRQLAGAALLALQRPADALPWLQAAARLNPSDFTIQLMLGDALVEVNERTAAAAAFNRVLQLRPGNRDALDALAQLDAATRQPQSSQP